MADPAQIVTDPDFLAASPQMKASILAKHDPDFAAASPDMQTRIVEKYGAGQRSALISGADRVGAQDDPKAATISNPPGTLAYVKAGLRQAAETVAPTIGLLKGGALGAAAGAPAGPVGALVGGVAGAGGGYALGEEANRTIKSGYDYLTGGKPDNPRLLDRILRTGTDVVTGAALDMLPPALLGVLRGGKTAVKGAMGLTAPTAETVALREAAARQGIDLPAGVASGSRAVSAIESVPGRFPIGRQASEPTYDRLALQSQRAAERIQTRVEPGARLPDMGPVSLEQAGLAVKREVGDLATAQTNAPTAVVDRFSQSLGRRPETRVEAGQQLSQGLQGSQRAVRAQADELYAAARAEAPPDAAVPLAQTGQVVARISVLETRLGALGNRSRGPAQTIEGAAQPPAEVTVGGQTVPTSSLPQQFIQQYGLDRPTPVPLELATELLKRVRALGRATTNDVEKGQFRDIASALTADIDAYGTSVGGNLGPALARAGQFYRDEVARDFAPKSFVRKLIDMEPGRIAETVLSAQPDKVAAIMRQTPAAQRPMVQRMVFDKLRERSIDPRTGEVDSAKFESALQAYGEDNLRAVFGARLADLNSVRQTLRQNFGRPQTPQGPGGGNIGNPFEVPMGAQPENVINLLTRGKVRSLEDFDALTRTLSPETQRQMRAATYDQVLREAFDPATGVFSPQRFLTAKSKVPQEIWDRLLTGNPAAAVKDLEMVYGQIVQHARAAGNPSQTSHGLGAMTQMGAAGTGAGAVTWNLYNGDAEGARDSVAATLPALLWPYALGKGVFSRAGQRALTSQPPGAPIDPQGGMATLGKILGIQLSGERR